MTFGHNPFIWTPVQVIKNAETASGTMVFNGMFDWVPGVGDDDEEDNGGTGIDFIDDIVDGVTEWAGKITETFKTGFDFITVKDKPIDVKTITKCCNGVPHRFVYGIYQVNEEVSARGGPRTVGTEVYAAGDKYATFREYRWTPANYQNGNDNGRWNSYEEGALGRIRADSLSDEYQVLADGDSQSIKDFYDSVITQRIGDECEDGPFGCMNETASNYNSNAICPDGSCECGKDESGATKRMNNVGDCVVVPCATPNNRKINEDGSCGSCEEGYHGGKYEECREKTVQCQVGDWSAWSDCKDGQQTRTRKIKTPPAGWDWTAGSCLEVGMGGALGTASEKDGEIVDTRSCTMPSTSGGTGGRSTGMGIDPNNCAQANRVKKDDNTCGDCKTDYEEDDDNNCVEIEETDTEPEEGLPMGWILGGLAVGSLALFAMNR